MAFLTWPYPVGNIMPTFIFGGLLLALGAGMMLDWAWAARHRMDSSGFGALCSMLLTSAIAGPTQAVFLALLIAVGSSHLRAARLNTLKYHLTGRSYHPPTSRVLEDQVPWPTWALLLSWGRLLSSALAFPSLPFLPFPSLPLVSMPRPNLSLPRSASNPTCSGSSRSLWWCHPSRRCRGLRL